MYIHMKNPGLPLVNPYHVTTSLLSDWRRRCWQARQESVVRACQGRVDSDKFERLPQIYDTRYNIKLLQPPLNPETGSLVTGPAGISSGLRLCEARSREKCGLLSRWGHEVGGSRSKVGGWGREISPSVSLQLFDNNGVVVGYVGASVGSPRAPVLPLRHVALSDLLYFVPSRGRHLEGVISCSVLPSCITFLHFATVMTWCHPLMLVLPKCDIEPSTGTSHSL